MGTSTTVDRAPSAGRTRLHAAVEPSHSPDSHTGVADRSVVSYQRDPARFNQQTAAAAAITMNSNSTAVSASAAAAPLVAGAAAAATPIAAAAALSQTADQIMQDTSTNTLGNARRTASNSSMPRLVFSPRRAHPEGRYEVVKLAPQLAFLQRSESGASSTRPRLSSSPNSHVPSNRSDSMRPGRCLSTRWAEGARHQFQLNSCRCMHACTSSEHSRSEKG